MTIRVALLGFLLVAACSPAPGETDAGAGDGGDPCANFYFVTGTIDSPPYILSVDGVVGFPSKVTVEIWPSPPGQTAPKPQPLLSCVSGTFKGPGGVTGPVAVAFETTSRKHGFTFTPPVAGTYDVTLRVGKSELLQKMEVFPRAPAPMLLGRRCDSVAHARGMIGCDDQLFTETATPIALLDGGRWLGRGDDLFAWQNGFLSRAEITDAGVVLTASTPSAFPSSWASTKGVLAVSSVAGGSVFELDGGSILPIATLPNSQVVTVFSNGFVALNAKIDPCSGVPRCQWERLGDEPSHRDLSALSSPDLVSANADLRVSFGHYAWYRDALECTRPDGGGFESTPNPHSGVQPTFTCGDVAPTAGRFHFWSRREPVSRFPLIETSVGVRVKGGAMHLDGAERISATDDWVWQSSATETAIWK